MSLTKPNLNKLLKQFLEPYKSVEEYYHAHTDAELEIFWSKASDAYVESVWQGQEPDPKYRFDQEYQDFWDAVERHYAKFIEFKTNYG